MEVGDICVFGVSIFSVSKIFRLDFGTHSSHSVILFVFYCIRILEHSSHSVILFVFYFIRILEHTFPTV